MLLKNYPLSLFRLATLHRGREGKKECVLCGDECESVSHTLWDCSAYTSIRAQFLVKLKASLGGSYARFETMSSLGMSYGKSILSLYWL